MAPSGTERDILDVVDRLKEASIEDIQKKIGFSIHYVEYLCEYLARKDYLATKERKYSLTKNGKKFLKSSDDEKLEINKGLIREIAGQVAKEVAEKIEHKFKSDIPPREKEEKIRIKTDFSYPVEDVSVGVETNIEKVEVNTEKETSDIDGLVQSLRNIRRNQKAGGNSDEG